MAYVQDKNVDAEEPKKLYGAKGYGALTLVMGGAAIGCCVPYFQQMEKYGYIRDVFDQYGSAETVALLDLPTMIIGGAALLIISGIVSIVSGFINKKIVAFIAVLIAIAGGALQMYASLTLKNTFEEIIKKLEGNPIDDDFNAFDTALTDFMSVVFNECCHEVYDSADYNFPGGVTGPLEWQPGTSKAGQNVTDNQGKVLECVPNNKAASCPTSQLPDIVSSLNIPTLTNTLCACYSSNANYDKFKNIITKGGYCNKFRELVVTEAGDKPVPTTSFKFNSLAGLTDYGSYGKIKEFAMVGKMLPPVSVHGEAAEKIGWSCGLGYAKGSGYQLILFLQDNSLVMADANLYIGAGALAAGLLITAWYLLGSGSSDDDIEYEEYDDYKPGEL